jgi:DNA-binding response OmpR family regulator
VRPVAILIERNPHLREQLAETMRRLGIALAATYDVVPSQLHDEVARVQPDLLVFPLKQAHAGGWRLVRELLLMPAPPVLMALEAIDAPAIRITALRHGVDYVFDPLLELDAFLSALRKLAADRRQLAS